MSDLFTHYSTLCTSLAQAIRPGLMQSSPSNKRMNT